MYLGRGVRSELIWNGERTEQELMEEVEELEFLDDTVREIHTIR
jgi:hypothetical protein